MGCAARVRHVHPLNDIDVIYFDSADVSRETEQEIDDRLDQLFPGQRFSVKNQARMHLRNGDSPYRSSADAMRRRRPCG
jgi:hypothetical protein